MRYERSVNFRRLINLEILMPPPSIMGEVYCFPGRQLIFSFDRRVLPISFERSLRVHSEIDSVCQYHDLQTNS